MRFVKKKIKVYIFGVIIKYSCASAIRTVFIDNQLLNYKIY